MWFGTTGTCAILLLACRGPGFRSSHLQCNVEYEQCPAVPSHPNLAYFWRFDDDDPDLTSSKRTSFLSSECRIGGRGKSLELTGDNSAYSDKLPRSVVGDVTLAAWLSLPSGWLPRGKDVSETTLQALEVISLNRDGCNDVGLEVRQEGKHAPALVLWQEVDGVGGCDAEWYSIPLPSAFGHWGQGSWYHVAASSGEEPTLYLDGRARTPEQTSLSSLIQRTDHSVEFGRLEVVGAMGEANAESTENVESTESLGSPTFTRWIDDVAVFDSTNVDIQNFSLGAHSVSARRPGEQSPNLSDDPRWITWGVRGSSVRWSEDCDGDSSSVACGFHVSIDKEDNGTAGLSYVLPSEPKRTISNLGSFRVRADIPAGKDFDFALVGEHGVNRCSWLVTGQEGIRDYEFSVADAGSCDCPEVTEDRYCSCNFDVVALSINPRWDWGSSDNPLDVSVCEVELTDPDPSVGTTDSLGRVGPQGWCWRPVTYDSRAAAVVKTAGTIEAEISGPDDSVARIAADFLEPSSGFLDVSLCTSVTIDVLVPTDRNLQFILEDANGTQIGRALDEPSTSQCDNIQPPEGEQGSSEFPSRHECYTLKLPSPDVGTFRADLVRYLGVEKAENENLDTLTEVVIQGVGFDTIGCDGRTPLELPSMK